MSTGRDSEETFGEGEADVDGFDSYDSYDGHDGNEGTDPLMAAILGTPLPEESRADPAFLAAHRTATADLAVLREQLGVIAGTLTRPAERTEDTLTSGPAPVLRPRPARRRAARALALAAAGAIVAGAGWLVVQVGEGVSTLSSAKSADSGAADTTAEGEAGAAEPGARSADSPLGDPGYLACARFVVEGEVTDVVPVAGTGGDRVTLRVTRSYLPGRPAAGEVDVVLAPDTDPLVAEGDHVLAGQARDSASPEVWAVGAADIAAERAAIERALPRTDGVSCE
ncbi:hypothetical protein ACIRG4_08825 [Streptomyces sp. NPDC102395]|uniref:hypothetical protein n=1 Tax=Streptomyces sp. NPDC102395 TaxID=3366168 RepID=UPI0038220487